MCVCVCVCVRVTECVFMWVGRWGRKRKRVNSREMVFVCERKCVCKREIRRILYFRGRFSADFRIEKKPKISAKKV